MKKLLALAFVLALTSAASAGIFGPLFSGSPQTPPSAFAPVVAANTCNIALPVVSQNVVLVGGGTCQYTATCNGAACGGVNAITSWAITAQSTANAFAVTAVGVLQGGSAASSVTTAAYTVTVTATNTAGTSPGVVQTVNAFAAPVVASHACTIKSPVTNGVNVVLQAGGNCQYTATCSGGACSGGNAISAWAITSQTRTNGYQITSAGILQGGSNAASITNETDTVTITATNAGGTSTAVGQTVTAITVPAITNQNFNVGLPLIFPQTIGTMVATANPASWAITAVSGDGASPADFSISNGGVITTTANAPTDITAPGTVTINMTATNATGTSAAGTATLTIGNLASCPRGTAFADGCVSAPVGAAPYPTLLNSYAARPPWNVAGVDYNVGTTGTLTPYTGQAISGWSFSSGSSPHLNSTTNGATLTGWDFSGLNNFQLVVQNSNVIVSNNSFKLFSGSNCTGAVGHECQEPVKVTSGTGVTFTKNIVDGGCSIQMNGASTVTWSNGTLAGR